VDAARAGINKGPVLADRARERSVLVALGSREGPHQAPQRPEFPYEDATSTEALQRLVNGSPPFRGNCMREDPTSPEPQAARARKIRARWTVRVGHFQEVCGDASALVNGQSLAESRRERGLA